MSWNTLVILLFCLSQCVAFVVVSKTHSVGKFSSFPKARATSLQSSPSPDTKTTVALVQDLLTSARSVGQVGSLASEEDQEMLLEKAKKLVGSGVDAPARVVLDGVHNLVYSAAPGGSSGRLVGPIYGKVQQTFLDDSTFINSVKLGPLEIALTATCEAKSNAVTSVKFQKTCVSLFGKELVTKEISGGGAWKYLYMDEIQDTDGTTKLVRVMETPSLFILEQPITSE